MNIYLGLSGIFIIVGLLGLYFFAVERAVELLRAQKAQKIANDRKNNILKEAEEVAEMGERKSQLREIATDLNRIAPPGEEITEEMIKAVERNMERVAEMVKSPEGKCKVIGIDKFDGEDWVEGEYADPEEAVRIAKKKTEESKRFASDSSVATVYYAYDPDGNYLGGDAWEPGEKGGLAK